MKAYIIMKGGNSPIAIVNDRPHCICLKRKDAKKKVYELNSKAISNTYWYESVEFIEGD